MERSSFLYKARRKLQAAAHHFFSNEFMSKLYFKIVLNKKLNLKNPTTFNEKLQWLKLYHLPQNPLAVKCANKLAVRDYIKNKGFGDKLVPLLGKWRSAEEIDYSTLPNSFVLKCNHGCAYNIVVSDKAKADKKAIAKQLNAWLKEDFGAFNIEPHYSKIKPRMIICEEFLGENLTDYNFFCFNGVPKCMQVSVDRLNDRACQIGLFYLDGTKMPLRRDDYAAIETIKFPDFFEEMKQMAAALAQDFAFVRADFFVANNKYYFAETTLTPAACMMPFNPPEYDKKWGDMLDISQLKTA